MKECHQQMALAVGMAPVQLKSTFSLAFALVFDAEYELVQRGEVHILKQLHADNLQLCHFVNALESSGV